MNVLILGATGLIGTHLMTALRQAGCTVIGASRRRPAGYGANTWRELDFGTMLSPQDWIPHLAGVDAVVNCVGIIRDTRPGDFDRLHRAAPIALFAACEQLGMRRVVQISALGSKADASTEYWRSKGAAEDDLLQRKLSASIVRPSLVYGDSGPSSRLFLMLASLPLTAMPAASTARVQPIHVDDLAAAVVRLVMAKNAVPEEIAVVGPRAMTMAEYIAELRRGLQAPSGMVIDLPMPIARIAARVAAMSPASALTPDSLTMLAESANGSNTADAAPVTALLGHAPRDPAGFAQPALLPAAVLAWGLPLMRFAIAALWLITAFVSWFAWPHEVSERWLGACGIPPSLQEPTLLAASLLDGVIGLALLFHYRRWLWPLQIALVLGYTVIMSFCLPEFWQHPYGPLSKNLPLLATMAVMWRLTGK